MRLLFLTLGPISSNPGHLARLVSVLKPLSRQNEVSILCLSKHLDNQGTQKLFPRVKFINYPLVTKGWYLQNKKRTVSEVTTLVSHAKPDLCVLQMEVWELVRELSNSLKGITKFATVIHAMPFVVSPVNPSGNFEKDVSDYLNSELEDFREKYVRKHYKEAYGVLYNTVVIAANKTVFYYLKLYFPDLRVWNMTSLISTRRALVAKPGQDLLYDFVYMARMEKGKGVEYLERILSQASKFLQRRVSIVILGRADDEKSKLALDRLLASGREGNYTADFKGWANNETKESILPNCGVFLYPSYYDNYPSVLNEALAYGLPVVTWDVPFTFLNYSSTRAVKRVKLFDFDTYALEAAKSLLQRDKLTKYSVEFINSFDNPETAAKFDTKLYEEIVKQSGV